MAFIDFFTTQNTAALLLIIGVSPFLIEGFRQLFRAIREAENGDRT